MVVIPEGVQQTFVRDYGGIVFYPDRLAVVTDIAVGGTAGSASGIPHSSTDNSLDTPEPGVGFPESAQSEIHSLQGTVRGCIQQRQCRFG